MEAIGSGYYDNNDRAIEAKIREAIDKLLLQHYEELKIIFASDERGGTNLVRNLVAEAYKISHDYSKRFNSDGAKIMKGAVPLVWYRFWRGECVR